MHLIIPTSVFCMGRPWYALSNSDDGNNMGPDTIKSDSGICERLI